MKSFMQLLREPKLRLRLARKLLSNKRRLLSRRKLLRCNLRSKWRFKWRNKNKKKNYKFVEFDRMINLFCNKLKKTKKKTITN